MIRKAVFLFLASVGLAGCGGTEYMMEFMTPSDVYIPGSIRNVALINRAANPAQYSRVIGVDGISRDYSGLSHQLANEALRQLIAEDTVLKRFNLSFYQVPPPEAKSGVVTDALRKSEIQQFCQQARSQALLSAEAFGIAAAPTLVGSSGYSSDVQQAYNVSLIAVWRWYDCQSLEVKDDHREDLNLTVFAPDTSKLYEQLSRDEKWMIPAVHEAAAHQYERIAPHWQSAYRLVYHSGAEQLREAYYLLGQENGLEQAIEIWKNLAANEKTSVRIKACYNLALASEIQGSPDAAISWLDQGLALKKHTPSEEYREILENRLAAQRVLEEQLGY